MYIIYSWKLIHIDSKIVFILQYHTCDEARLFPRNLALWKLAFDYPRTQCEKQFCANKKTVTKLILLNDITCDKMTLNIISVEKNQPCNTSCDLVLEHISLVSYDKKTVLILFFSVIHTTQCNQYYWSMI